MVDGKEMTVNGEITLDDEVISFGDLNDRESEVSKLLREPRVISVLKPEMGNDPSLYYLGLRREVT